LISNSFDVGATEVFVNSGYSNFNVFTCSDNGKGMSVNDFVWSMQHIGGSLKRSTGDVGDFGRPIIGKLGIGILAVSQICKEFTIESSAGSGEKFEATIDLSAFETIEAAKKQLGKDKEPTIRIGSFEPIVYREKKRKTIHKHNTERH
jgi:HSP90 family molecular chaperone